jgi:hypothetical protein
MRALSTALPDRHAICGYVVHAQYPLRGLPICAAIDGPLGTVILRPGEVPEHLEHSGLTKASIEVSPDAVLIKPHKGAQSLGRILVRGGREILVAPAPGCEPDLEPYILGSALGAICLQNGLLPLHASAVSLGSEAIAFAGPTGAGKSTMAAAIAARGHVHVTDDLSVVRLPAEGLPLVYPGTRVMKLCPDSSTALGFDEAEAVTARLSHEKLRFRSGATTLSAQPDALAAIYFLELGDSADVIIEPLIGMHAIAAVASEIFRRAWLGPMGSLEARLPDIAEVARRTACFRLKRPHRFDMLPEVVDTVLRHRASLRTGWP